MKVQVEHDKGILVFYNEDRSMEVVIDTHTDTVESVRFPETSIQNVATFVNKVKSTYNKLLRKKEAQKFIEGVE